MPCAAGIARREGRLDPEDPLRVAAADVVAQLGRQRGDALERGRHVGVGVREVGAVHHVLAAEGLDGVAQRLAGVERGVGVQALFKTTDALGLSERLTSLLGQTTVVVRGPKPTGALTLGWFGLPALGIRGPALASVIAFALAAILVAGLKYSQTTRRLSLAGS